MAMVSGEEDNQGNDAACKREGRRCGDRKAKSYETLSNFLFIYEVIVLEGPALCMKACMQRGPSAIGNALVLFRVRSTVRVAASRAAGWPSAIGNALGSDSSQARQFEQPR